MRALLFLLAASAWAAGCDSPEARQFDFWLGEWEVEVDGQVVAQSRIEKSADGCLIVENWMPFGGGEGKSWNFYDAFRKHWEQIWVTAQGGVLKVTGGWHDGAIREEGVSQAGGQTALHRHSFTPVEGGKVRQFCEESKDGGRNWVTVFVGLYHPMK